LLLVGSGGEELPAKVTAGPYTELRLRDKSLDTLELLLSGAFVRIYKSNLVILTEAAIIHPMKVTATNGCRTAVRNYLLAAPTTTRDKALDSVRASAGAI
jgi:hypothetical protein